MFQVLLDKVKPNSGDRLILLGDLFDRGSESWEVFQTVQKLDESMGERFVLLKGNHEDYLLTEKLTFSQKYIKNTSICRTTLTEYLLNTGRRPQTTERPRKSPCNWV